MKKQQDMEKRAEQTLNSLNGLQETEANPYLYAKIKQRMDNNAVIDARYNNRVMLRLAAILILFIGVNSISFYVLKQHAAVQATTSTSTGVAAFAKAYGLNADTDSY